MSDRIGFMVYKDWREVLNDFDDKLYRELMEAIFDLGFNNVENNHSPLVTVAFKLIKPQILRDWEKYINKCNRNRTNGLRGGRPKSEKNQENPLGYSETPKTHSVSKNPQKPSGSIYIKNKKEEIKYEKEDNIESIDSLSVSTDPEEKINYKEIVEFYNNSTKGKNITACVKLTEKRKSAIRARLQEYGKEKVFEAITRVAQSSFCNGHNNRNWRADIDFVFNPNKFPRILEGKYDNETDYGSTTSNSAGAYSIGEKVLGDIFTEIQERQRAKGVND